MEMSIYLHYSAFDLSLKGFRHLRDCTGVELRSLVVILTKDRPQGMSVR